MKKNHIIIILCALLLIVGVVIAAVLLNQEEQQPKSNLQRYSSEAWGYFDTYTTISGYAETKDEFVKITDEIFAELKTYHQLFDIYNRYDNVENLYKVNKLHSGEHRVITVDRKIIDMLLFAKEMYAKTNGKVNIAMGSVTSLWHDCREDAIDNHFGVGEIPAMDKLQEEAKHTDINNLIIDEENSTVYIADPQMKIDVGAIAKGYAVEMVAKSLEAKGIDHYVINVGGNIRTIGSKANGDGWAAGIENPGLEIEDSYIAYIGLSGEAIVTSGSYQRYFLDKEGNEYHHIIDGETLMPANYFVAVSVICPHSGMGDGLSTALFCMSLEDGMALVESLEGVEAIWTSANGTIVKSSGFERFEIEYKP